MTHGSCTSDQPTISAVGDVVAQVGADGIISVGNVGQAC